ncbi:MAG TPA: MBL fold metallo-hydrolase [Longimicrobiales bacterium]|nr:MBL fold metallo-hydrolase [Longimicrobiales bacterium]
MSEMRAGDAEPTVRLLADVEWVSECYPVGELHEHVSVYLIHEGDRHIIIDTGSFYHRESIAGKLREATLGRGVQALILSHSDYPHSGNIPALRREWGDFEIFACCGDPQIQGLPYATQCRIGGQREIFGRLFSFVDPPLADRSHTSWIYDHGSKVLFAADGFGNYHVPGECALTSLEIPGGIRSGDIHGYHRDNVGWMRYVDPARLRATLERMFERFDIALVAPVHGNPVAASELGGYLDELTEAARRIVAEYVERDAVPR